MSGEWDSSCGGRGGARDSTRHKVLCTDGVEGKWVGGGCQVYWVVAAFA